MKLAKNWLLGVLAIQKDRISWMAQLLRIDVMGLVFQWAGIVWLCWSPFIPVYMESIYTCSNFTTLVCMPSVCSEVLWLLYALFL